MAVSLTFDAEGCVRALVQHLVKVADILIKEFYNDATRSLSAEGKADSEVLNAIYDAGTQKIEATCKFYAQAIMESFGTGLYADRSSDSYWNEYAYKSDFWNPERKGQAIVGRPKGEYTNIYGVKETSTGRNRGKLVEGYEDKNGDTIWLSKQGTHSIQTAEAWLIRDKTDTKVERRVKMEVEKFLSTEASKFFKEVGV